MPHYGKLVAFEGCPGSSAQKNMEKFKTYLDSIEIPCEIVRMLDSSTDVGALAFTAYYDYFTTLPHQAITSVCNAERYAKQSDIGDMLRQGIHVLVDRYILCAISESLALSEKPFELGNMDHLEDLLRPDMVVYFESVPEDGLIAAPFCIFASLFRLKRLQEAYHYAIHHFYYFSQICWTVRIPDQEKNFCKRLYQKLIR